MIREPAQPDDADDAERPQSGGGFLARLREWFGAAIEVPPAERAAWLEAHIADPDEREALARLLASDADTSGFFETPASQHVAGIAAGDRIDDAAAPEGLIGTRIGAFRLVRLLGKGGMAAVFLGEREGGDFRQLAAVKLLRRGLYSELEQRLFQRERQVLATLSHANIAHLIDGGLTDAGIPFLIMEYVDGVPVTRHAAERSLGVRDRVRLFLTICRAVEAAHRSLVVHRDIKPSNILVTRDGAVKLLDFGIAKLVEDDSETPTAAVFTPEYAAPEQLAGRAVTTATDVYALGVLLYELLIGSRPATSTGKPSSQAGAAAAGAAPPQILQRALRGDLDNILMRALEAEPERRYASAGALADDVQRYLDGRPVEAHPPSRWYRARKFVLRHRGGVAITTALVLGIVSALGLAIWQAQVAFRQEQAARHEAQRANAVRDFIEKLFEPVSEGVAEGKQPSLGELVVAGVGRLDAARDLGDAERVDLMMMFARLHADLGEADKATALAVAANDRARATLDPLHPEAVAALAFLGNRYVRTGDHERGEPLLREAQQRIETAGTHDNALLDVLDNLSVVEMDRDRSDLALALSRQALEERIRRFGEDGEETATGYNNLGYGLVGVGRFDEAAEAYRRTYEIDTRFRQPDSYQVLEGLSNWGWALARGGHARAARLRLAEVDDGLRKLGGKPRGLHLMNSQKLCIVDLQIATEDVVADDCTRMLATALQAGGESSRSYAGALGFEAMRLITIGELAAAEATLDRSAFAYPDSPQFARERGSRLTMRTEIAWLRGAAADARDHALAARQLVARQKDSLVSALRVDAMLLLACRSAPDSACPRDLADGIDTGLRAYVGSDDTRLLPTRVLFARYLIDENRLAEADLTLGHAIEKAHAELDDTHPVIATARVWRAIALDRAGACTSALRERDLADAASARRAHPWFSEARAAFDAGARCNRSL